MTLHKHKGHHHRALVQLGQMVIVICEKGRAVDSRFQSFFRNEAMEWPEFGGARTVRFEECLEAMTPGEMLWRRRASPTLFMSRRTWKT